MKRSVWITAALIAGLLLVGIAGYFFWHTSQNKYVKADHIGMSEAMGNTLPGSGEEEEGAASMSQEDLSSSPPESEKMEGESFAEKEGEIGGESDPDSGAVLTGEEAGGPVRLVFAGDILLSDHVLGAYSRGGGIGGVLDPGFFGDIEDSDIFMANQEFPFSSRGQAAPDKQFTFRLPPEKVSVFKELGLDIVTLANNHALDFGTDALLDTCDTLDQAEILHVGAGRNIDEAKKPVFLESKGKKVGFLGASRVIPVGSWNAGQNTPGMLTTYDPSLLVEEIHKAREKCDFLVVYVHWGIERDERPQDYQRKLGQQYIDAGADLVIGSHPHVLQGFEYYKGKPIVYSLGNFIFGSSIPKAALLTVEWDGMDQALKLWPGTSSAGYTRMLLDDGEKAAFYQYMTSISYGAEVGPDGNIFPASSAAP